MSLNKTKQKGLPTLSLQTHSIVFRGCVYSLHKETLQTYNLFWITFYLFIWLYVWLCIF